MSRAGAFETIVGLVVVAVAVFFSVYAFSTSDENLGGETYRIDAVFSRIDGVRVGAEVRIAGVQVGTVAGSALDPQTYEANVEMKINRSVAVPDDSVAKIVADGVLGGAHVAIEPGASESYLREGEKITITRGSVDLLNMAVQAFTSQGGGGSEDDSDTDDLDSLGDF